MMAVEVLHSICQQIWKTQQWPQDWKRLVFIPKPKKDNAKECSTTAQLHSSHILASAYSNSYKIGFKRLRTEKIQMYQLDLEKAEESETKLPTFTGSYKKKSNSRKASTSASVTK